MRKIEIIFWICSISFLTAVVIIFNPAFALTDREIRNQIEDEINSFEKKIINVEIKIDAQKTLIIINEIEVEKRKDILKQYKAEANTSWESAKAVIDAETGVTNAKQVLKDSKTL